MNHKAKSVLKSFSYTFSANVISMAVATVLTLILPKYISKLDYTLFMFYALCRSYIGFFHFGWADGMYLRYGGKEYKDLPKKVFHSQFVLLSVLEIIIGALFCVFILIFIEDANYKFIFLMTAVCCILVLPRTMLQMTLESTNQLKLYARNLTIEKVIYGSLIIFFLILGYRNFELILVADIIAKAITLFTMCLACKDIILSKSIKLKDALKETFENISVGFKLMFANIADILILGIIQFSINSYLGQKSFGVIAFSLRVSTIFMLFISSMGIVMFPLIKRTPKEKWGANYNTFRNMLMIPLLGLLLLYYPAKLILIMWLPKYTLSMTYMAILFPMCIYEGKKSLLISTYMKAMRMEKYLLLTNVVTVVLSFLSTCLCVFVFKSITMTVVSVLCLIVFRSVFSEIVLAKRLNIKTYFNIILELSMTLVFVLSSWFIQSFLCVIIYFFAYAIYILIRKKDVKGLFVTIKQQIKAK